MASSPRGVANSIERVLTPLQIDLQRRRGYLHACISGPFSIAAATAMYAQLLQAVARERETRILMDCTGITGKMTTDDRLQFGIFMAEEQARMAGQLPGEPQVAILVTAALMDPGRFTQVVANNRGVRMRSSESPQELLSWLGV